jgi:hypothetical protein
MLDDDPATIKRWISKMLGDGGDGRRAALARYCGFSQQAVSGWMRTGRMRKGNVTRATEFLGTGPEFDPGPAQAGESLARYSVVDASRWPFERIDLGRLQALTEPQRARLEGAWLVAAAHLGISVTRD